MLQALSFGSFSATAAVICTVNPITAILTTVHILIHDLPLSGYCLDWFILPVIYGLTGVQMSLNGLCR
jgi:hypothetical protein